MITIEPPSKTPNLAHSASLKRTLLFVCLILLAATVQAQTWHLTWADEFNAPNGTPPNPANWNIVIGGKGFGNQELETYTAHPTNVQQQDGNLVITARKEDLIGPDGVARNYTSARINTQNHFTQKYGRFEARIKLPSGQGIWPAFWMLGDDHDTTHWPNCGEIDILETIGETNAVHSTIHGKGYSGSKSISTKFTLPAGQQVDTDFHLYSVEWSPTSIKFFFDDHLIVERTPASLPPNTKWAFDHPFYLLLNLAVGGNWPGNPDATTVFPQQMLVDYVRVYTSKPEPSEATTKPVTINLNSDTSVRSASELGAPYLDSEMWASPKGRPLSSSNPSPYTTTTTGQAQP